MCACVCVRAVSFIVTSCHVTRPTLLPSPGSLPPPRYRESAAKSNSLGDFLTLEDEQAAQKEAEIKMLGDLSQCTHKHAPTHTLVHFFQPPPEGDVVRSDSCV